MELAMLRVRCVCGWEVVGTEEEVVPATQEHGRLVHNMAATREQVLAMAAADPAAGAPDPADPASPTDAR
jgi:hypothetical protein